jgi:hypothetical protein
MSGYAPQVGHSYMYLITHLRRKGIYHGAFYLRNWNSSHPISTYNLNFVILDDPICIYKVASQQVIVPYVPDSFYI